MSDLNFEIKRKTFHILGLLCPVIYIFTPKLIAIIALLFVTSFVVYVDIYRHSNQIIQYWTNFFLGKIMRKEEIESKHLASCSWMFLGLTISCILYPKNIAIFSWIILFVCDSAAAVIGAKYGSNFLVGKKTFEGSLAFFILTIILGLFFYNIFPASFSFLGLVFGAIAATYTELYSKHYGVDDNIAIPLILGLALSIF